MPVETIMPFLDTWLVHFQELQIIGIQLTYTKKQRLTLCWIGIVLPLLAVQKKGRWLLGSDQPSIADLSLACEILQLEVLDEKDRERILGPLKRVVKWHDDKKNAMGPHFEDVQSILYKMKVKLQKQRYPVGSSITQSSRKHDLHSKM
ncbi:unnamed protein product [Withania somnifera]